MLWMSFERPDRQVRRVAERQFLGEVLQGIGWLDGDVEAERAVVAVFGALQDALGNSGRELREWQEHVPANFQPISTTTAGRGSEF